MMWVCGVAFILKINLQNHYCKRLGVGCYELAMNVHRGGTECILSYIPQLKAARIA